MTDQGQKQLGKTLRNIADQLRGAMNADDFRDYMLAFLFLRYLSDNYEQAARKELGTDYPDSNAVGNGGRSSLPVWYEQNSGDISAFEKQMRLKAHYVIRPEHLWASIAHMARTQNEELLNTLQAGFKYIENESFQSTFFGLFSEINLGSENLGKTYANRNAKHCVIITNIADGLAGSQLTATHLAMPMSISLASSPPLGRARRRASFTRLSESPISFRRSSP
ncbi:type I restriction-modification system subunit M N-terminal domain-containing protein [Pseudonocardia sp. NPDC049154]|uniref:type I restriction-modification system subunit M N-terminal domain-containing protein n=1 Tax=Pseudonocardia sp. NPDC049154 TaxID=3155501 RepID=UPI0033FF277D